MNLRRLIKAYAKVALERRGYWWRHRSVLPLGIEHLADIQNLASVHNVKIECAFDIGAHVGETAAEFLNTFPAAQIYSFEPLPEAFALLEQRRNPRLRPIRLAMSNLRGASNLYVRDPKDGIPSPNSSLVAERQYGLVTGQSTKTITVSCDTVDNFCSTNAIDAVQLLKIDTEGSEIQILDGAVETLRSRDVRFVFVEFETLLPVKDATGGALTPIAERLEPLGFRLIATYTLGIIHQPLYTVFNALYFCA